MGVVVTERHLGRKVVVGEEGRAQGQGAAEPVADPGGSGGVAGPGAGANTNAAAEPGATKPAGAAPATEPAGSPPPEAPPGKPPKRHRRRWVLPLSLTGGVIVILIIAAFVTAHFTSSSSFCNTCHEMNPYTASWQASTHASAQCRDCHIPPGIIPYIETKLGSFREIYVHLSGNPEPPLAVTRKIPNASCFRCHANPPHDPVLPHTAFAHAGHSNVDCISCHIRLVHRTVSPPVYVDPAQMASCLKCHDGSQLPNNCSYCHTPPHEPRGECSDCHTEKAWANASMTSHPFALTGAHADLACTDCHVSKPGVENIPGTSLAKADAACVSCHGDRHGGLTDCASCHTPTSFANVSFTHPFPLTGAHAALACKQCHVGKPGGATVPGTQFPLPDPACVSCHGDHHNGLTDCATCHTPSAWQNTTFVHPPAGEHRYTSFPCASCHPNGLATHSCTCHGGAPPGD